MVAVAEGLLNGIALTIGLVAGGTALWIAATLAHDPVAGWLRRHRRPQHRSVHAAFEATLGPIEDTPVLIRTGPIPTIVTHRAPLALPAAPLVTDTAEFTMLWAPAAVRAANAARDRTKAGLR